jgi:hypothetical protein
VGGIVSVSEAHILVTTDKPSDFVLRAKEVLLPGEELDWHIHDQHEDGPGGVIVGWDVLVVTSHESHNAALTHAGIERERNPAADVELQPVIGDPPGEETA